jgi:hypothetical protein
MAPRPTDPENIARAYELYLEYGSGSQVQERLRGEGRPASLSTVHNWINQGQNAAAAIDLLERAEEVQKSSARLDIALRIVVDALRNRGSDPVEVAKTIVLIEKRRADLLGLDAPKRISVSDESKAPPVVDPVTVAAVRAARNRVAEEERTLLGDGIPELPGPGNI